jgi:membrane protein DedA with SNARE-associated domain
LVTGSAILEEWITRYGYAAIFAGTFAEGETILVLAGFAAHRGYLELPWVITSAFIGTLLGDQVFFYIGRAKGITFLETHPTWNARAKRVFAILDRHQTLLILGFRFLYGLRTVTPFLLGASRVPRLHFLIFNLLGAAIWALLIGLSGYIFGQALELLIGDVKRYELWLFAGLAGGGLLVWCIHFLRKRNAP